MNTETQNYKIIVAYDGTRYKGWQVQKSTDDTIQGKLQHVLSTLAGKPVEVIGSGRTDAGVHAVGQVASFHMPKHFSKDEIFIWLNEHLPADIAVTDISNVPDRFHARYNAVSKTYVYTIHTGIVSDVFRRKYVYDYDKPLDTDRMKKAAAYLLGEHDFKAFCGNRHMKKSNSWQPILASTRCAWWPTRCATHRTSFSIDIEKTGADIVISYTGDGFLQNMIRIITGTLIEVGDGRKNPDAVMEILASKDRAQAGYTAPACGLRLERVDYGKVVC